MTDPFGDVGDDAVSTYLVSSCFFECDEVPLVVYAVEGVVVGPAHESFAFCFGESADGVAYSYCWWAAACV